MGAGHSHGHGHSHSHGAARNTRRLKLTLALAAVYLVAEVVGGIMANSLALLADAGHMLSDVGALALSLFAIWMAQKPATPRRTFGYHRTEILAALANAATLIAISISIFVEAWHRFRAPEPVAGLTVMIIAVGGLAVNVAGLVILHGGRDESLNIRGAWLHLLTDALGSVGAIAGGLLIWAFGWAWADPAVSVAIAVLVLYSSWHLLKESVGVLLEGTPAHINLAAVRGAMLGVDGVEDVHDLHVWTITSGLDALSAHVVVGERTERRHSGEILSDLHCVLHDRFGLHHLTIQIEPRGFEEHRCVALGRAEEHAGAGA
ncbi:MAG: Cobalt-zinc-cadmium resistance protein CzcD [uncultured Gemmatimonadetes bacterium]|uniref:Cobalt-zinc-cadmium resistance protein CzcD n=1 Tax=uncultured Gemmatimonadota bacterium TaxID=203437 RepID=A0A6J4LKV5_9BACT|nr:MAG: Cobalt-zinc-cadmium resistance protein CzcD [uncultured Gemmatimonadota bacterium]